MRELLSFLLLVIASIGVVGAETEKLVEIRTIVTEADPDQGQLLGSLFNSEQSYMRKPLTRVDAQVDSRGSAILDFGRLPTGDYAVVVIYDLDNDGELDIGIFGIPTEKVGFSNNAQGRFGPARWKDTRFHASDDVQMEIHIGPAKN